MNLCQFVNPVVKTLQYKSMSKNKHYDKLICSRKTSREIRVTGGKKINKYGNC